MALVSARCPGCGAESFLVSATDAGPVLACAACGTALGGAAGAEELAELKRELQLVREELTRLRQAVNFLNQRVR